MLENWCWEPSILQSLSCHYSYLSDDYYQTWKQKARDPDKEQPPKQIPLDLATQLADSRNFNAAISNLRQLHWSTFDMAIHTPSTHDEVEKMDYAELYNKIRAEFTQLIGPEAFGEGFTWGQGHARFGHPMRGYDAQYWGYSL